MFKSLSVFVLIVFCSAITGCMGHNPMPIQTIQYGDESKSCLWLQSEMAEIEAGIAQKTGQRKAEVAKNLLIGGASLVLFWPGLLLLNLKGAKKVEIEALGKRHQYLQRLAADKGCDVSPLAGQ